ncbi:MAG: extracellular solute-binding protein, partial [Propionibacteriaceae bacterium]|nr:extracellular solute-binding protein [Propionibacteriaceae bacterium]
MQFRFRKTTAAAAAVLALGLMVSCSAPTPVTPANPSGSSDAVPDKPSSPVTLNILDVAGDLQLTQGMIDEFVKNNPDIISSVTYDTGTAPDLPGKLKAQQDAGRVSIDMVLTGTDGLASGISQGLYLPIADTFKDRLTNMANYLKPAADMQTLAQGQGVVVTYYPSGPLLEYNPDVVTNPPTTPDELLAWAKANPGKFGYARPANSGPGRTFIMGLPYILGDSNPQDPVNGWTKTWDFLKQLDQYIDYYPTGTTPTMQNIGNGTWDMIASTTGWDINPRVLGTVPANFKVTNFTGFTWVTDAHYVVVPKGVSADKQAAIMLLINDMLTPEQNAKAYDKGYFYPGPAVQGATLAMAPQESQDAIAQFGRPEYDAMIANNPTALPLSA